MADCDNLNKFEKVLNWLFPYYGVYKAHKKLLKTIKEMELLPRLPLNPQPEYMGDYRRLSVDEATVFLDKTLERKTTLEDKAKVNVFGVTIAVSLVTGLFKVVPDFNSINVYFVNMYKAILLIFALYSIGMMIWSGLISLKVLSSEISQYEMFPNDIKLPKSNKRDVIALVAELNNKTNLVRSNYLSSSYDTMKKSLATLLILFCFFTIVMEFVSNNNSTKASTLSGQQVNGGQVQSLGDVTKSMYGLK